MSKISSSSLIVEQQWEKEKEYTATHLFKTDYKESHNDKSDNDESNNGADNLMGYKGMRKNFLMKQNKLHFFSDCHIKQLK